MLAYFGPQLDKHNFNRTGVVLFQCQLHRCKTSSMTQIKYALEEFRSDVSTFVNDNDDDLTASNPFSTLICQLNEIRSTGGWALVECVSHIDSGNKNNVLLGGTCKPIVSRTACYFKSFFVILSFLKSSLVLDNVDI